MSNLSQSQVDNIVSMYQHVQDVMCSSLPGIDNTEDCQLFSLQYATVLTLMAENKAVERQIHKKDYLKPNIENKIEMKQEFNEAANQACAILGPAGLSSPYYCQELQPIDTPWWNESSNDEHAQWQFTSNFRQQVNTMDAQLLFPCVHKAAQASEEACSSAGVGLCRWSHCGGGQAPRCQTPLAPPRDCSKPQARE